MDDLCAIEGGAAGERPVRGRRKLYAAKPQKLKTKKYTLCRENPQIFYNLCSTCFGTSLAIKELRVITRKVRIRPKP